MSVNLSVCLPVINFCLFAEFEFVCMSAFVRVAMCSCVCVRARERESARTRVCEKDRKSGQCPVPSQARGALLPQGSSR